MERAIYEKINGLIITQIELLETYNMLSNTDSRNRDVIELTRRQDELLAIAMEISKLYGQIHSARDRATSQILYNDNMIKSYTTDCRKSPDMKDYVMLTVNPRLDVTPQLLLSTVKRFLSLSVVEYGCYNIEQRGEEKDQYIGFHSHILFKRAKRPSEVLKEMSRIFLQICGGEQHFKYKSVSAPQEVVNYIGYMLGKKDDTEKLLKVENDKRMRSYFDFDDIYVCGRKPPTCWVSALPPTLQWEEE